MSKNLISGMDKPLDLMLGWRQNKNTAEEAR